MMFLSFLALAAVANASFDTKSAQRAVDHVKKDVILQDHVQNNLHRNIDQSSLDRLQKDLTEKTERLTSAEIFDMMLPAELKGSKIVGSVEKSQTIVERFLRAILPTADAQGNVEYKYYGDMGGRCDKSNYVGQVNIAVNKCWRIKTATGNLNSIMIQASNANDGLTTVMKVFTDGSCVNDYGPFTDDEHWYSSNCERSPTDTVGFRRAKWMKVKHSKKQKIRAKDIDSERSHVFGESSSTGQCSKGKFAHSDVWNLDCFPNDMSGSFGMVWMQGTCQGSVPDKDSVDMYYDDMCTQNSGYTFELANVGCAKWGFDDDNDDQYNDDQYNDDQYNDDGGGDDWAPWSGLQNVEEIMLKYEGGMCFDSSTAIDTNMRG